MNWSQKCPAEHELEVDFFIREPTQPVFIKHGDRYGLAIFTSNVTYFLEPIFEKIMVFVGFGKTFFNSGFTIHHSWKYLKKYLVLELDAFFWKCLLNAKITKNYTTWFKNKICNFLSEGRGGNSFFFFSLQSFLPKRLIYPYWKYIWLRACKTLWIFWIFEKHVHCSVNFQF